jgi:hypothetical protein
MRKYLALTFLLTFCTTLYPQSVYIDWQQCYGGTKSDNGVSIALINDGHLISLSTSRSNDMEVSLNHGDIDFWLFETDETGNLLWEKSFGGSENDIPVKIMIAPDGGFVLFGETWSNDGDVSGNHGGADYWLVKTDSLGNLLWQRCLGSSMNNLPSDMDMDDEGNIYIIGLSLGTGGDVTANNGSYDYWFLKINPSGNIVWNKNIGGMYGDFGKSIATTPDGGVIVGGLTDSNDGDVTCNTKVFNGTAWLVKLDSINNIEWQQCYGGTYTENIIDLKTTDDGGYILLGLTNSNDGDVIGFHGIAGTSYNFDIWVIKTDSIGQIEWQRCLGGTQNETPDFIKITPEGNYLIGGTTNSNDGDVSGNHSNGDHYDQWLVKLNDQGTIMWQKCIGSGWNNSLSDAAVLSETEMIIFGGTPENNTGDIMCDYKGDGDAWMYKLIDTTVDINELELYNSKIKVYPNPANTLLNIDFPEKMDIRKTFVEIIDINGRVLINPKSLDNITQLDISKLNSGIYLVKIQNDKTFITRKIIKQ